MSKNESLSKVYLALGANVDTAHATRYDYLCFALDQLEKNESIEVVDYTKIYETLPVGYADQANFLNCVIEIKTNLNPQELLKYCKTEIEEKSGRKKVIDNGPRTIDVDILLFNDETLDEDNLKIPHSKLFERAFVLVPLKELAPELVGDIEKFELVDEISGVIETEYSLSTHLKKYVRDNSQKSWA